MRQYEMFELAFAGTAPAGSEVQVNITAVFTNGEDSTKVKGFYAGNDTYKVRFYAEKPGTYKWSVCGTIPTCDGKELILETCGTEECIPAESREVKQNGK